MTYQFKAGDKVRMTKDCPMGYENKGSVHTLVPVVNQILRAGECNCQEKWELVEEPTTKPKWTLNKTLTRSDGIEITEEEIKIDHKPYTIPEAKLLQAKLRASLEAWNKHFN